MATNAEINDPISSEFRNLLLELVVAYLIDQPPDFLDFAIEFLTEKKEERRGLSQRTRPESETEEEILEDLPDQRERRRSVFAEVFDPAEEEEFKPPVYNKSNQDKAKMMEYLKDILIFRSLDRLQKEQILDAMIIREVSPEEVLIREGEEGDYFYIIESGEYAAWKDQDEVVLKKYINSGSFGELALLYNVPRACSVKAVSKGVVWALDRLTFRKIVLTNAYKKRKMYEMLIDTVPLLSALNEYERMSLADALITQSYRNGQKIISQGDTADGMYFIETGKVRVSVKGRWKETEVKQLGPGEYFGELALLTSKPRAASVYAVGQVRVAFLDVEAFERLLGPCMDIMKRNLDLYETQLNQLFGRGVIDPRELRQSLLRLS